MIISGYLYGNKVVTLPRFYLKSFSRIYRDYFVFLIIIIPIFIAFTPIKITLKQIILLILGLSNGIPGLGHLWFISTILLCYLITPLLNHLYRDMSRVYLKTGLLLCIVEIILHFSSFFVGAWVNSYIIGFSISRVREWGRSFEKKIVLWVVLFAVIANGMKIYMKYIHPKEYSGIVASMLGVFSNYCHVLLGLMLFLLVVFHMRNSFFLSRIKKILAWSDAYSYDVYLMHHVFILGPFSLLKFNIPCITLIVVIISLASGALLKMLVNKIEKVERYIYV